MAITLEGTQGIGWHKGKGQLGCWRKCPQVTQAFSCENKNVLTAEDSRRWHDSSQIMKWLQRVPWVSPRTSCPHRSLVTACPVQGLLWTDLLGGQGQGLLSAEVKVGQCAWALAFCFTPVKTRTKSMTLQPSRPTSVPYTPKERCLKTFLYAFHIIW